MKIQIEKPYLVVFESAIFRTTSSLIIGADHLLLVDPNWLPIEIGFIADYIKSNCQTKKKYLLFTHSDYDHIIGYGRFKECKTIASQNFIDNPNAQSILNQINEFDDENYIERNYQIEYPKIDLAIKDAVEKKTLSKDEYVFYQAPGHNSDGLMVFNQAKGILIVGDYLSNIEFPYIYHSLELYKGTLNTLWSIIESGKVNFLISGHGDYSSDIGEMKSRVEESRDYISQLERSVKTDTEFDLEALFKRYKFPIIMRKFHEGNIALAKKE